MSVVSGLAVPAWVEMVLFDFLEDLDFVEGRLHIVRAALLNLHGDIGVELEVLAQPDRREVPPAQLLDDHVAIDEHFADVDWVVSTDLIIFYSLVLGVVVFVQLHQEFVQVLWALSIRERLLIKILGVNLLILIMLH